MSSTSSVFANNSGSTASGIIDEKKMHDSHATMMIESKSKELSEVSSPSRLFLWKERKERKVEELQKQKELEEAEKVTTGPSINALSKKLVQQHYLDQIASWMKIVEDDPSKAPEIRENLKILEDPSYRLFRNAEERERMRILTSHQLDQAAKKTSCGPLGSDPKQHFYGSNVTERLYQDAQKRQARKQQILRHYRQSHVKPDAAIDLPVPTIISHPSLFIDDEADEFLIGPVRDPHHITQHLWEKGIEAKKKKEEKRRKLIDHMEKEAKRQMFSPSERSKKILAKMANSGSSRSARHSVLREKPTFMPSIDKNSAEIDRSQHSGIEQRIEKELAMKVSKKGKSGKEMSPKASDSKGSGKSPVSRVCIREKLISRNHQKHQALIEKKRHEMRKKEIDGCTFQPQLVSNEIHGRHVSVISRSNDWVRKQRLKQKPVVSKDEEKLSASEFTFKPDLSSSSKSYHKIMPHVEDESEDSDAHSWCTDELVVLSDFDDEEAITIGQEKHVSPSAPAKPHEILSSPLKREANPIESPTYIMEPSIDEPISPQFYNIFAIRPSSFFKQPSDVCIQMVADSGVSSWDWEEDWEERKKRREEEARLEIERQMSPRCQWGVW
ncbi:hypothetical protein ADUPG1_011097 [Aduncisulcus paluster]|uniref:Uncharacterized protein n=1 Tax=Aduncisulcus paluster TaxID=2918883 RepID=A0ABQ5JV67_9EUKA|nr:hypothetical protein ADUPG1_011097 [Aduncisulcus paluster]